MVVFLHLVNPQFNYNLLYSKVNGEFAGHIVPVSSFVEQGIDCVEVIVSKLDSFFNCS